MVVRFWGVRGSIPAPMTSRQIQAKISAAIQRIKPGDIESPDAKERFIASLPAWLFGTTGGNTPCVEVKGSDGTQVILDAGTGLRNFGKSKFLSENNHFNFFISHFHWDHIQGLPFFDPIFKPNSKIDLYSTKDNAKDILSFQQKAPYFPVEFSDVAEKFNFHKVESGKGFELGCFYVNSCEMSHPGGCQAYSFSENGRKFVYATDVELTQMDFLSNPVYEAVFGEAQCIVIDSQYTVEEAYNKTNWGHSAFCYAIDFAVRWGIKKLYLFHHEPMYDDKKLNSILLAARWYAEYIVHTDIQIYLATENLEIEI